MKVGYVRISKNHSDASEQLDVLQQAGCQLIFIDTGSDLKSDNSGLETTLGHMHTNDTLIVWRLECLGRSLKHLVDTVNHLAERGIGFQSLHDAIDTTTADGQRVFEVFATLAEFQRNVNRERTKAGLRAAKAMGRKGGRPRALNAQQTQILYDLYDQKQHSNRELCRIMGISDPTLKAYLRERQET